MSAEPQLRLTYSPCTEGGEAWLAQLEILRAVVAHLSPKEVLFELNINKSTLSEALSESNDKRWAARWTHVVKAMLARRYDETAVDLLQRLCESDLATTPHTLGEPDGLTPEQERDALRAELARMGEQGQAAIDRVKRKAKRGRR